MRSENTGRILLHWYRNHKRDLPWRSGNNPYHIWLSEIILQQTQVAQGLPYFNKFKDNYPTIVDLAQAPEDDILKLWQGLGYYSRARNLHSAAKTIVSEHHGIFPSTYQEILSLKGVGPYTAAAIASIAFEEATPVVDGNVIRVISRLVGIESPVDFTATRKEIEKVANELLNGHQPSQYNQAIMEFGALQCTPKSPDCLQCPLKNECEAYISKKVELIPLKSKKVKRKRRYFHFLIPVYQQQTAIEKRGNNDIWRGLYQFPLFESTSDEHLDNNELSAAFDLEITHVLNVNTSAKHVLSHQDIFARFYHVKARFTNQPKYKLVDTGDLHTFALPRLIDRYLENYRAIDGKKRH